MHDFVLMTLRFSRPFFVLALFVGLTLFHPLDERLEPSPGVFPRLLTRVPNVLEGGSDVADQPPNRFPLGLEWDDHVDRIFKIVDEAVDFIAFHRRSRHF